MSETNGHAKSESAVIESRSGGRVREESVTDADYQRICAAYDPKLQSERVTQETFEYLGCKRVTVRLIGRGKHSTALTYEVVPDNWFFKDRQEDQIHLCVGSKVTIDGETYFLDAPVVFRRKD